MDDKNLFCTDFLFSKGSFLIGAGSVINLSGNYFEFNTSNSDTEADEKAIRNDFRMIGQDIVEAGKVYECKTHKKDQTKQKLYCGAEEEY